MSKNLTIGRKKDIDVYDRAVETAYRMRPTALIFDFSKISSQDAQRIIDRTIQFDYPTVYAFGADLNQEYDEKGKRELKAKSKEEKLKLRKTL